MTLLRPGWWTGALSVGLYALNTVFWTPILYLAALLKLALPLARWRRRWSRVMVAIAQAWIRVNNLNMNLFAAIRWDVAGVEGLSPGSWYLVLSNHQSWVDILVLQRVFLGRIPFLRFFAKRELLYVPLLGLAWWALDFPLVKRYSAQLLARRPELRGRDLDLARRACRLFKDLPSAILNFAEGTRFRQAKRRAQDSPFARLLKPRAGGPALVLAAMADRIKTVLDVTLVYPQGAQSFWQFVCGRLKEVRVRVRTLPCGPELVGDYAGDEAFRRRFQTWLNGLWQDKERLIQAELDHGGDPAGPPPSLPGKT